MVPDGDGVSTLLDRRYDFGTDAVRVRVLRAPESAKFPDGIKYAFHYGPKENDDPHLRYDNLHGVHERHEQDSLQTIEFPGYEALLERFREESPVALDR